MTVKNVPVAAGCRENLHGNFVVPCNILPRSNSCSTLLCLTTCKHNTGQTIKRKSKMPFSSLRFDQFCDFRPKVCFSTSGSKRFEILPFSYGSLTPSIFLGYFRVFFILKDFQFLYIMLNACT
ncbi:hypothetical protein HanIR_Chr03g0120481 [Helianthus annuus]|nr:hypothetical protein HanIR_Chr03g0120481 [Helianthus annuus]